MSSENTELKKTIHCKIANYGTGGERFDFMEVLCSRKCDECFARFLENNKKYLGTIDKDAYMNKRGGLDGE